MTRITAIASAPRPVKTRYGDKLVIDCRLSSGETVTIWKEANNQVVKTIANGERIQLDASPSYQVGKSYHYDIVETAEIRAKAVQANLAAVDAAVAKRYKLCEPLGF